MNRVSPLVPMRVATATILALVAGMVPVAISAAPSPPHPLSLPKPLALTPFISPAQPGEGQWAPAGRRVNGQPAIYTTTLRPLGNPTAKVGVAWIDQSMLRARLYSGSMSPGGSFWTHTTPLPPAAASTLVAAFNGGFLLKDSHGGYLSEGHLVAPLVSGAASLVIYRNGSVTIGAWNRDVWMNADVLAVRQNLTLLVNNGVPAAGLKPNDNRAWGGTLYGVYDVPRSALGITANGALVYADGPINEVDLAKAMVRAGAVKAMVMDINPPWPIFATYTPSTPTGEATGANGKDLAPSMTEKPDLFFQSSYQRDFITLSTS